MIEEYIEEEWEQEERDVEGGGEAGQRRYLK